MTTSARRSLVGLLVVACLAWHALAVLDAWRDAWKDRTGRDFASYHYAVEVARGGGDPYDVEALGEAARADGARAGVHPFFYPPPFLLPMAWVAPLDLVTAYRAWFWLDEVFALAAFAVLAAWWRPLGPVVGPSVAAALAALTAIPNNHVMGQMNLPVVLLVWLGAARAERGRDVQAGVMLGAACMMKMSPALLVALWLLHRRWRAVAAAVATALVLEAAALAVVPPASHLRFYAEVLPGFASGRYNGLGVGIDLYGNHSLPNVWDALFPAGGRHLVLSETARALSTASSLLLVGGLGVALRRPGPDALARAGAFAAVGVTMLLVPVFTYEHHLVWATPAVVAATAAVARGRLAPGWAAPLGLATAVWAFDLAALKRVALWIEAEAPFAAAAIRESKMVALLVLLAAAVTLARTRPEEGR